MIDSLQPVSLLGIVFLIMGAALLLIPLLARAIPSIEELEIPWLILYIYRSNGFTFVTSPILLLISALTLFYYILR